MTCLFCQIVEKKIPAEFIYEDENFVAFLDIRPINLGHALLLPRQHHRNLFDLPANLLDKIGRPLQIIAAAVKKATSADGLNIGWNNEPAAGQLIFHSHVHVMPRFVNDGYRHWLGQDTTKEELAAVGEKIRKVLSEK